MTLKNELIWFRQRLAQISSCSFCQVSNGILFCKLPHFEILMMLLYQVCASSIIHEKIFSEMNFITQIADF